MTEMNPGEVEVMARDERLWPLTPKENRRVARAVSTMLQRDLDEYAMEYPDEEPPDLGTCTGLTVRYVLMATRAVVGEITIRRPDSNCGQRLDAFITRLRETEEDPFGDRRL